MIWLTFLLIVHADGLGSPSANSSTLERLYFNYDAFLRPNHGGPPLSVSIGMYLLSIEKVDEKNMDFTLVFFLEHRYNDSRLSYSVSEFGSSEPLKITGHHTVRVWDPDTYIVNNKDNSANGEHQVFKIHPDGRIVYIKRFHVRATCHLDLRKFPMDVQYCGIEIESFSYGEESIILSWMSEDPDEAIEVSSTGRWMSRFTVDDWKLGKKKLRHEGETYSSLSVTFTLTRKVLFFILQFYIPTFLIVVTSWVSFWVDNTSIPGRVGLSITTVLAMTTLMYGVQSSLPEVPYTKAIDVFLIASFTFVFSALVEFAAVSYHQSKIKLESKKAPCPLRDRETEDKHIKMTEVSVDPTESEVVNVNIGTNTTTSKTDIRGRRKRTIKVKPIDYYLSKFHIEKTPKPDIVDRVSRIAFPVLYFVFNLAYWLTYTLH